MKTLEELRAELADLVGKMEAINAAAIDERGAVRNLNSDEEKRYADLEGAAKAVRGQIARVEELRESRREVERLNSLSSSAPSVQVTREHNCNESGEYRGYREIGKGGLGEFLQDVREFSVKGRESKRLSELRAATGANETVQSEGGFLTQSDHADVLFTNVRDAGAIASQCTEIPMSNLNTTWNMIDETSVAMGSQFGGITAYWRAEAAAISASKPKFKPISVRAEAMDCLIYATDEQLADAPQLEALFNVGATTVMGFKLDAAIIYGDGAGKPLGITKSPCRVSVAKENNQTADTVVYANVDNMVDRLLVGSEAKAQWLIHPGVRKSLRNMTMTPGSKTDFLLFMPANGMFKTETLLGYPVNRSQACKKIGDEGDIILADLSQYLLFRRNGIAASQSMHVAFLTSEMVFKWSMRVNGMPQYSSAITDADGTDTRSPFVTLADRA